MIANLIVFLNIKVSEGLWDIDCQYSMSALVVN